METEKQPPPMTDASVTRKGGPAALRWARAKLVELFGADLRSLAAFRIVLALLVLADLALRATDFYAHYTDDGVLPRAQLLEEGLLDSWKWSLALASGEPLFQALVFGATALAALGLLLGYRTRLSTVIVWALLMSIHWRNPLLLNAGDTLLRLLLFWGMFLPLGAYWSVDRLRKSTSPRPAMLFLSIGTIGLFVQIASVYVFTAIIKSGDEWRVDGTALYYALHLDQLITPFGAFLSQFPTLLKVLTFSSLGLEVFGPFLLFCPFFTGPVRTAVVFAFMSFHYGIWMTMELGVFPWISAFCMVCFLPGWFWDKAGSTINAAFPKFPSIQSQLQRVSTSLVSTRLLLFGGQSSVAARLIGSTAADSVTSEDRPGTHTSSAKAVAEAQVKPERLRPALLTNLLAAFFLVYITFWNVQGVTSLDASERVENVGAFFGLHQYWSMFAPHPPTVDGWYVIPGTLRSGQEVDLMPVTRDDFEKYGVSWEKPQYVADTYETNHWRKYLERVKDDDYPDDVRIFFADYLCDEWNARHEGSDQLMRLQMVYMVEETLPDYQRAEPQKVTIFEGSCGSD
jgi:hypothetical protein